MAYKLLPAGTEKTSWAVVWVDTTDAEGKIQKQSFKAKFLIPTQDAISDLIGPDADNVNDEKVIDSVLKGWAEVDDENNEPLAFTKENVELVMQQFPTRPSTVRAWLALIGKQGKRKN